MSSFCQVNKSKDPSMKLKNIFHRYVSWCSSEQGIIEVLKRRIQSKNLKKDYKKLDNREENYLKNKPSYEPHFAPINSFLQQQAEFQAEISFVQETEYCPL